jgi:hypothetical protein
LKSSIQAPHSHCGRIRFEVKTDIGSRKLVQLLDLYQEFRLLCGAEDLATYQFGTMTARHQNMLDIR